MKRAPLFPEDEIAIEDLLSCCSLNVLVIYDSRDSAIRAKAVLDNLFEAVCNDFSFHCDFWRLDVLEFPEVQEQALDAGRTADVIIIAARDCADISAAAKAWLFEWVAQKTEGTAALVGLFERCNAAHQFENQVRSFLRPLTAHVDFFIHEEPCRKGADEECAESSGHFNRIGREELWKTPEQGIFPGRPMTAATRNIH